MHISKISWLAVAAGLAGAVSATEATNAPTWETQPEVAGMVARVPLLKHPFPKGWQQTLFWWPPSLSPSNPATLSMDLQNLAERGLVPYVGLDAEPQAKPVIVEGEIALAKAIAAAGYPVHIQMLGALDLYVDSEGKRVRHADAPEAGVQDAVGGTMPCLIQKTGWGLRAHHIEGLMRRFADAKVPVAAVWYDYEGHPHPWNGVFEANGKCPSCRKECPAGVLDSRSRFLAWTHEMHTEALVDTFAKPVLAVFPKTTLGFYGYTVSSQEHRYTDTAGVCWPPSERNPAEISFVMPVCYADTALARRFFNADWPIDTEAMDAVYFATLLRTVSNVRSNLRADQTLMPFVSSYVSSGNSASVPRMSKSSYREFLRHAILRGARGFYCFNVAPPYGTMEDYYQELAEINAVYNELFAPATRAFLEGDIVVLNNAWPDPKAAGSVVWSGLRKGNKALVRIVKLGDTSGETEVVVFPGKATRLLASPAGATYVVSADGRAKSVE